MRLIVILSCAMVLTACGGGGGGGPPPIAAPAVDITGTYTLVRFTVLYDDGSTLTSTSPNVTSFGGSSIFNTDGTYSQIVSLNGVGGGDSGTYSNNAATIFVTSSNGPTGTLAFQVDGSTLITVNDHQNGSNNVETDVWLRVGPPQAKPWSPPFGKTSIGALVR